MAQETEKAPGQPSCTLALLLMVLVILVLLRHLRVRGQGSNWAQEARGPVLHSPPPRPASAKRCDWAMSRRFCSSLLSAARSRTRV